MYTVIRIARNAYLYPSTDILIMKLKQLTVCVFLSGFLCACGSDGSGTDEDAEQGVTIAESRLATVTAVNYSGEPGNYIFSVTVESPDLGCNQYADWWEVLASDETLLYRRILTHSHINEQPFTRSGGPVNVSSEEELIVRAHMNNLGYGTQVFRGSIEQGFEAVLVDSTLAAELEDTQPLPDSCAF